MVASILARLRTMPGSASSRSTSWTPNRATAAGSKPANTSPEVLALAEDRAAS
jgi:hypothetical protein